MTKKGISFRHKCLLNVGGKKVIMFTEKNEVTLKLIESPTHLHFFRQVSLFSLCSGDPAKGSIIVIE